MGPLLLLLERKLRKLLSRTGFQQWLLNRSDALNSSGLVGSVSSEQNKLLNGLLQRLQSLGLDGLKNLPKLLGIRANGFQRLQSHPEYKQMVLDVVIKTADFIGVASLFGLDCVHLTTLF